MRKLISGTWKQRAFYGFTFLVGVTYQPNFIYENFYFNPRWRDEAWWAPRFELYLTLSGLSLCFFVWGFARFSKKYL
jgi:hypothetical protein